MAMTGDYIAEGYGVRTNVSHGLMLTMSAAERGSDVACYFLGEWHRDGTTGLPKDKKEAIYWYKRATDGSCSVRHLMKKALADAKAKLEALEANE
mmetsp:Transcript_32290/g.69949  ORF Transcript_32290/g.69949 Transcript_32290/m.69949 type:complete len:95 (+) Transcript_32290:255-539(+)